MITVRQIQRLWNGKAYERLLGQLTAPRPEASGRLLSQQLSNGAGPLPTAALMVVRLDELAQSYVPLYSELVRTILAAQRPDGGWGDVMTTALCLRALLCGQGHGTVIDRGLTALGSLQKEEGIWPGMPVKRMPADAFASAYVLLQLADSEQFRQAVKFDHAVEWFTSNELALDEDTKKLWAHARRRRATVRKSVPTIKIATPAGLAASAPSSSNTRGAGSTKSFWDFSAALAS